MVSCRSWTLRISFAVRSCRSLILIFHFAVVSCGSWTLRICFAVRSCRSSILIFHFTVVSCGSWTLRICFAVRSCRSWILIFHFAVVSCGSWTFEELFCREILQILDLEISVCRRILWILDPIFWPRHKSGRRPSLFSPNSPFRHPSFPYPTAPTALMLWLGRKVKFEPDESSQLHPPFHVAITTVGSPPPQ